MTSSDIEASEIRAARGDMPSSTSPSEAMSETGDAGHAGDIALAVRLCREVRVLPADDVVHAVAPLMREVAGLHARGRVARIDLHSVVERADGRFGLRDPDGMAPRLDLEAIERVQPKASSALKIVGEYRVTTEGGVGTTVEDLRAGAEEATVTKPVHLTDLRSWEIELGHHDEITDIHLVGMIMACVACGLDPSDHDDIERFSLARRNLFALAPRLHPVLASIILEATALNRHERATDLGELARRLETHRDQPVDLDIERTLAGVEAVPDRRTAVLTHLRDRLFDLSRRNRLVHFRATQSSIDLTEASMPLVLRLESVRADQLCTWKGRFPEDLLAGRPVPLARWLRFEDQPHLPSALDRIIQETRHDRAEYGFSHLRLVIAFLHWNDLKEAPDARIHSPLLWLPVEVTRTKGVRDQYMLRCPETRAEFNPALRHVLRQLYGIVLPEEIDLETTSIAEVHRDLTAQIRRSEPGVRLELQDRPRIRLILQKAVQRVERHNRRRGTSRQAIGTRVEFSYERDDYRPLGRALFEAFVRPSPLPQRLAAGGAGQPAPAFLKAETEALTYARGDGEGHRYSWEIDLTQVTLANFNYKKMSLVRDFAELIERPEALPAFDQVFSIDPRSFEREEPGAIPPAERWNVVASDATQDAAVALARTGRSFIIQGPPGTGKSQTITNLIADHVARGKRVLFVCEKRAALDVVFHRLGQAGLGGLATIIHDSQEDKKGFIADLGAQYEQWGAGDDGLDAATASRERTVTALDRHLTEIERFDAVAGGGDPMTGGVTLRELVRRAAALPAPAEISAHDRERLPTIEVWDAHRPLVERSLRLLRERTGLDRFVAHPFARLTDAIVAAERPHATLSEAIDEAEALLDALDDRLEAGGDVLSRDTSLGAAEAVSSLAERLVTTGLAHSLDLIDSTSPGSANLAEDFAALSRLAEADRRAAEAAAHWRDPLSVVDTHAALALAQAKETSFFRFLSGDWRALRATVEARYDFGAHAVAPSITSVLTVLAARHSASAALVAAGEALRQRLRTSDLVGWMALRDELLERGGHTAEERALLDAAGTSGHSFETVAVEARAVGAIRRLRALAVDLLDEGEALSFDELAEVLRDLREAIDDLPELAPVYADIGRGEPRVAFALRRLDLPLAGLDAVVVDEAIARIERRAPEIRRFDIGRMIELTRRAAAARERLDGENAAVIRARVQRRFRDHVRVSETSVSQLDGTGREFKKAYAAGRREMEREFAKTMRHRSIRDLASGETGAVVDDLKPIWLMSPLSVSDTLPLASNLFDVVIFDEASQIPIEEAIPALTRADQVIVVGDEMQLPPTNFFSAALDDGDMEVVAEDDGERIAILLDADSLLKQAARNLPATLLAWHYRSRSETLIGFSNAAFYAGQLVTIPDRMTRTGRGASEPVASGEEASWSSGVDRLLAQPITSHRIADGVYEGRVNGAEARYIAGMTRELLARGTGRSVGIVAFSEAQQGEIEAALERLAADDPSFAAVLEAEYAREENGQFNGLFVKNLENVQGDERDVIVMSVCYAPGRDGRMAMNFGPINQRGGEKRLNVIFSRARHHMAIVSTISPEAITNVHNDGARALRSFLSFAEAQSRGATDHAQAVLAALNPDAARIYGTAAPVDAVRSRLAEALRARGHEVHEHVGSGSFRCDLAVVDPGGAGYGLAILLDREAHAASRTEERFVFRPGILRAFGWRVLSVPVTAWLRAQEATVERIEAELTRNSWDLVDADPFGGDAAWISPWAAGAVSGSVPQVDEVASGRAKPRRSSTGEAAATGAGGGPAMTEYRFTEGTSDKFWRVGVAGCDLVVEFGRAGSKGQRVVKSFDTAARAAREAGKLTQEKIRKGYAPVA